MKKIKKIYYYFFYKIYKSIIYTSESLGGEFLTDFKTIVALGALEIWLLLSIGNYYSSITGENRELSIQDPIVFFPLILIFILNYFSFINTDVWKKYNEEFDKLPEAKNKRGGIIIWSIIILIIVNLIFSFYCLSQQSRK
ncbi:hypothetical protein [Chryseobacterium sp. SIMBA_029]|uniref:hypothetical protein n=1 Tax=Chryseobacterium sp. SIMBA_029 TaxID=3085772 RepID=UPI003978D56F